MRQQKKKILKFRKLKKQLKMRNADKKQLMMRLSYAISAALTPIGYFFRINQKVNLSLF
jgi:hypothetical protein